MACNGQFKSCVLEHIEAQRQVLYLTIIIVMPRPKWWRKHGGLAGSPQPALRRIGGLEEDIYENDGLLGLTVWIAVRLIKSTSSGSLPALSKELS